MTPKVLAFAGSTRTESYNKKLAKIAFVAAQKAGADATLLDLRDYPLPLFDGDLEERDGSPENAKKLKAIFKDADAFLIASPEYNSSLTAVLKNAIDWVSRPVPNEPSLVAFTDKVVGLLSASPGALGGLRGLVHLRSILSNINCLVLADQLAVPRAFEAFAADGSLKDAKQQAAVERIATKVVETARRLRG